MEINYLLFSGIAFLIFGLMTIMLKPNTLNYFRRFPVLPVKADDQTAKGALLIMGGFMMTIGGVFILAFLIAFIASLFQH
jgi:hypothetical protein